jgi:hypothetical protein
MDGLLTGTIYAAVSAISAAQPAEPSVVAISSTPAEPVAPAAAPAGVRGYVIVDIPAFNRDMPPLVTTAEPARRAAGPPSEPAADPVSALAEGLPRRARARAPVEPPAATPDFDAQVIAAHDARIHMLKQRIERAGLESGPMAGARARDLAARLMRAEAARDVAVARAASTQPCEAGCVDEARAAPAIRSIRPAQVPAELDGPLPARAPVPAVSAVRPRASAEIRINRPDVSVSSTQGRRPARTIATPSAAPTATPPHAVPPLMDPVSAAGLSRARKSLAIARDTLERDAVPGAVTLSRATVQSGSAAPVGMGDAAMFLDLAAARFGMAIASLLLLIALVQYFRPRAFAND